MRSDPRDPREGWVLLAGWAAIALLVGGAAVLRHYAVATPAEVALLVPVELAEDCGDKAVYFETGGGCD